MDKCLEKSHEDNTKLRFENKEILRDITRLEKIVEGMNTLNNDF